MAASIITVRVLVAVLPQVSEVAAYWFGFALAFFAQPIRRAEHVTISLVRKLEQGVIEDEIS